MSFTNSCNYTVLIVVGGFVKVKYSYLSLRIVWVSDIHKHSVGLLIKAIKMILDFLAWV
jgi:hypothetical protein